MNDTKVVVHWLDAITDGTQRKRKTLKYDEAMKAESVGFLERMDEKVIVLCQTRYADEDITDTICIPRGMVTKIEEVIEKRKPYKITI